MFGSFCCCILLCQTPTPFRPVAMVLAVEGPVELQRAEAKHRVEVMDVLQENDRLILADGQRAELLVLHDNHRERLKTNSQVVVKKRGCEPPSAVDLQPVVPSAKQGFPGLADLGKNAQAAAYVPQSSFASQPATTRGGASLPSAKNGGQKTTAANSSAAGPSPLRVAPLPDTVILTDRPSFSWPGADHFKTYQLTVYDSALAQPVLQVECSTPSYGFPPEARPIVRGREYRWQVSAKIDNSPGRQLFVSRFYVLGRSEYECLTQVEPLLRSSDPADWLVAAAAYTEVGADGEALALYDRLVSAAPQTGAFHAARGAVLERIGRMIEAQQARATARSLGYTSVVHVPSIALSPRPLVNPPAETGAK
jgi:hypothetical protein